MPTSSEDGNHELNPPDGLGTSETAAWCLERTGRLLKGSVEASEADEAHRLAMVGLESAMGADRLGLIDVAIAASLVRGLQGVELPAEYLSWVDESASLGSSRSLAALPARLQAALGELTDDDEALRTLVFQYESFLLSGWDSGTVDAGGESLAQLIHEISFYLSSILVFDVTGIPAALGVAERIASRRLTTADPEHRMLAVFARLAVIAGPRLSRVTQTALTSPDTQILVLREFASMLERGSRSFEVGVLRPSAYQELLLGMERVLSPLVAEFAPRLRLEVIRQLRILGRRNRSIADLAVVSDLLTNLAGDPRFDPDEVTGDLVRLRADQHEVSGDVSDIVSANELANDLLNKESSRLENAETLSAISLARFLRYLAIGLLADLEEAHAYNLAARAVSGVSADLLGELLLNGGAIRRNIFDHNKNLEYAKQALRDYEQVLGLDLEHASAGRRSALHNLVSLVLSADSLLEEEGVKNRFESAVRELGAVADGEPRYLLSAAQGLLLIGNDRKAFVLGALDLVTEALCVVSDRRDVVVAFSTLARCIDRLSHWEGPDGWIYLLMSALAARAAGATIHMRSSAALVGALAEAQPGAALKEVAYREFVVAARRLLASQISGDERRQWLEQLDGFPSAVLVDLAAQDCTAAIAIAEAARALVGVEALSLLAYDAGVDQPAVAPVLDELRSARIAADFATDREQAHAARLRMQTAQDHLRQLGHPRAISPLVASTVDDFDRLQAVAGDAPTVYLAYSAGSVVAIRVTRSSEPEEVLRVSLPDFARGANRFLEAYDRRRADFGAWAAAIRNVSGLLWDAVIGPLIATSRFERSMTIVPCGGLTFLPFHLAWRTVEGTRRHLLEDYDVQYSPGLTLAARRPSASSDPGQGLLGVSSIGEGIGLKWLAEEEAGIRSQLDGFVDVQWANVHDGPEAVLRRAGRARYFHLAAHGEARLHAERLGYVELGSDRLDELAVLANRLDNLALVVLSSCDSGRIDRQLPDELRGLPLAFLAAGARAVLASAWPCDDLVTSWLMSEFYERLAGGDSPARALCRAQTRVKTGEPVAASDQITRELREPWRTIYRHEVYWGAFFVTSAV
ncbi:MAG: hypothetical protein QOD92_436 [Acidimicrobiaceae bacterium]|jgi:CHAT domain-containing protein